MDRAPFLRVLTGDGRIFNVPLKKRKVTIGRNKDNDIVLADNTVSRHHAEIVGLERGFFLSDLGSYNGTKVNGKQVQTVFLRHDDKIEVGLNRLTFAEAAGKAETMQHSIVLTNESDYKNGGQKIVESSPSRTSGGSRELLVTLGRQKAIGKNETDKASAGSDSELTQLARSNKVLFVLYEISRQLNQIHDFNELLKKIMDLIFVVIDADYGFLVLTGSQQSDELIPVVVKYNAERGAVSGEMRASRTLIHKVVQDKVALLTSNAMADARLDGAKSVMIQKIRSAMCVPLWRKGNIIGVIQLDSVRFDKQFTQDDLELLKAISTQMAMVIEQAALNDQIREEERMRSRLERFHSPQVIEMILKGGQETKDYIMEPKELTATILFTDIIGFTRLSEKMPPREVNVILNRYFSRMSDIIFSFDGTLDKYIGDGLMAVFGAPMEKEDDAERAIRAALEMRRQLAVMMKETAEERSFDTRIGINTGRVVAGNIGSPKRIDYTVIGDPVNIASRLESAAGPNQILIGEETYRCVKDKFEIREVGPRKVKGKSSEIVVYEVIA